MAETLLWCCAGSISLIGTNLYIATQFKSMGVDVAILFDKEALVALAEKKLEYEPVPLLKPYAATIEENMKKMGFPAEPEEFLKAAATTRVQMYACAGWSGFLGVAQKLPSEVKVTEIPDTMQLIAQAKKIIGGP